MDSNEICKMSSYGKSFLCEFMNLYQLKVLKFENPLGRGKELLREY